MRRSKTLQTALIVWLIAPEAYAQSLDFPRDRSFDSAQDRSFDSAQDRSASLRRFEIGAGGVWIGATRFGTVDATETAADGSRFRLFSTSSTLDRAGGVEAHVAVKVMRALQAEVSGSYMMPRLATRIDSDFEGAPAATVGESIKQITVGGALVLHLTRWSLGRRIVPFVRGGVGYLRQIHETQTLITSASLSEIGGGVSLLLGRRMGLRADVRAVVRQKNAGIDQRAHVLPALGSSLFVRF